MRVPINKLLLLAFLSYLSYEIYNLYTFCRPPVVPDGHKGAVVWDLRETPALDLRMFLATRKDPPHKSGNENASWHVLVGEFKRLVPARADELPDLQVEDLGLPEPFFANGTVYLHVVAAAATEGGGHAPALRHATVALSRYVLQADRKVPKRNLVTERVEDMEGQAQPVASLPKVIEVGFVQEVRPLDADRLREKGLQGHVQGQKIRLPLYVNALVSPQDEYLPLDRAALKAADASLGLQVRYRNVGLGYWTMQLNIEAAFDEAERTMGMNSYDVNSFKQMIGGSSPAKILCVYGITILHLIFEYMAFTSDINFWRKKTSFEGLSSSSVAMQAGINIISFLYVQEQRQTKFVMYFIAFRFLLQLWKLRKLTTFRRHSAFPFVRWVNRAGAAEGLEELEDVGDAEQRCMRYLMLVLFPVVVAFCAYRLVHQKFRSWYSWLVLSLAICAQTGGFVVMTPQVFMNYRLKSVDHLPWRALTYQAINTFIDDVFALCIRMPEVQKYSVFRDDIIFGICCYQRWIYRKKRKDDGEATDADTAVMGAGAGTLEATPKEKVLTQKEAKGAVAGPLCSPGKDKEGKDEKGEDANKENAGDDKGTAMSTKEKDA